MGLYTTLVAAAFCEVLIIYMSLTRTRRRVQQILQVIVGGEDAVVCVNLEPPPPFMCTLLELKNIILR